MEICVSDEQFKKILHLSRDFRILPLILHKIQGSGLLKFQNSSGFSLIVDTLITDTECIETA